MHSVRPAAGRARVAGVLCVCAGVVWVGGCSTPQSSGSGASAVERAAAPQVAIRPAVADVGEAVGPAVLVPRAGDDDDVVATVGGVAIRESDIYDRMLENDPRAAALWVDLLVLDVVVADLARQLGVTVAPAEVADDLMAEESLLREDVERQLALEGGGSFEDWLRRTYGLDAASYRRDLERDLVRRRYRQLVIRYLAQTEDRVEVRFLVHTDAELLRELREKVLAGADVAAIARQHSQDRTREDGGHLGPFSRAFRHPVARAAHELEPGQVSEVIAFDDSGTRKHALVYCLRKLPGRDAPFAEVRDEIERDLEVHPVTRFEQRAFVLQYCGPTSALDTPREAR